MTGEALLGLKIGECASPFGTAAENLAFEQLLASCRTPCFVTHRDRACVSLGFNPDLSAEVDVSVARRIGVDIVRRPTGGGAVYRDDGCICYSFVVPDRYSRMPVDLVAEALRTLGFPVERTGRNDLFLEGAKVSGFAWEAIGGMSVVHGTLLHSTDINVMDLLVGRKKGKYRGTAMASAHSRVANLSSIKPMGSPDEFQVALHRRICDLMRERGAEVCSFHLGDEQRESVVKISPSFVCRPSDREAIAESLACRERERGPLEC